MSFFAKALIWLERPLRGYLGLVLVRKHWSSGGKTFDLFRFLMAGKLLLYPRDAGYLCTIRPLGALESPYKHEAKL